MDLSRIKKLLKNGNDKFIMMENGEPELVVMSFKEYEKLSGSHQIQTKENFEPESAKEEFIDLDHRGLEESEFVTPVLTESIGLPVRLEDIHLEDLPI